MKGKSALYLCLILLIAGGLAAVSYFGIGANNILGVENIKQGLDLKGGVSITYEADKEAPTAEEMASAQALIRGRLDRKNYTDAEVAQQGVNRLRVDIPGVADAETAIKDIGQTAQLNFADGDGKIVVPGTQVKNATKQVQSKQQGGPSEVVVELEFTSEGSAAFAEATKANIGKPIYILLDDGVISAPTVNSAITDGRAIITGGFTAQEAEDLASLIRAGSLPFKLTVADMSNVGARLGANSLSTSIFAGFIGIVLVLIFILVVYKMLGLAADIALIVYIGLVLTILSLFGISLTLPGIAGIVLSIGMAVDANVIIFERIKEEIETGKSLKSAVDAGFKRAFAAILDSNVTTLIAGAVLFWLGSGPIKGFAQTLSLGICISMFTALFITRVLVKSFVGIGVNNPKLYSGR